MDSGTATHPPCPMCDPSILPEDYAPINPKAMILRPDGSRVFLRGIGKAYLNGVDVTAQTKEADPERGVIVAYHRVMAMGREGKREMVRHFCNREGLDKFDPQLEGGHACCMTLTGEVFILDPATGEAPVYWEPEDVGSRV